MALSQGDSIVVGVIVAIAVLFIFGIIVYFVCRKRNSKQEITKYDKIDQQDPVANDIESNKNGINPPNNALNKSTKSVETEPMLSSDLPKKSIKNTSNKPTQSKKPSFLSHLTVGTNKPDQSKKDIVKSKIQDEKHLDPTPDYQMVYKEANTGDEVDNFIDIEDGVKSIQRSSIDDEKLDIEKGVSHSSTQLDPIIITNRKQYEEIKLWFMNNIKFNNDIGNEINDKYFDLFINNGYNKMELIYDMNDNDLINIGMNDEKHRNIIIVAINNRNGNQIGYKPATLNKNNDNMDNNDADLDIVIKKDDNVSDVQSDGVNKGFVIVDSDYKKDIKAVQDNNDKAIVGVDDNKNDIQQNVIASKTKVTNDNDDGKDDTTVTDKDANDVNDNDKKDEDDDEFNHDIDDENEDMVKPMSNLSSLIDSDSNVSKSGTGDSANQLFRFRSPLAWDEDDGTMRMGGTNTNDDDDDDEDDDTDD